MPNKTLKHRMHEVIFEADTKSGRRFDLILIVLILLSVVVVMFDSVPAFHQKYQRQFLFLEWGFTIIFTIEYILRLYCIGRPLAYAKSFYGLIDLIAVLPTYLSIILPGAQYLLIIRSLRVLRVFRVLKFVKYLDEAKLLSEALRASRRKITVFLFTVLIVVTIFGSLMYLIEGEQSGFTSIPISIYWAIVTMTTVGYGDIAPATMLGRTIAAVVMIMGYAIIAVPTGIVSVELARVNPRLPVSTQSCPQCSAEGHEADARHCKYCGAKL